MKITILNGKRMTSKRAAHEYIKRKLEFPDYYGENLDALWDILTTISQPLVIVLLNSELIYSNLEDYGRALVGVFAEAMEENPNIELRII